MAHLLPREKENQAAEILAKKIEDNGYRLSTGFVGTGILMQTLSWYGNHNMAYNMLIQMDNPSCL